MPFDQKLAERINKRLAKQLGLVDKKIFGGVAFLINGNLAVFVHGNELGVRMDPEDTAEALAKPHTRLFDMGGRTMKGWILVGPKALATAAAMGKWIDIGVKYAESLPKKKAPVKKKN